MLCKNCDASLNDTINFCDGCGAKVIRNRLTIKNLFQHFSEHFLNYDNTFLKTVIHLITKPELVIGGYIDGTRKKYVNAISYFAIALTFAGLQMFIINKFYPEVFDFSGFSFHKPTEAEIEMQKNIKNITLEYQSIIMMFYIPIYALISKLTFFNIKKYNYTEHLVIFMYIQAQISIFSTFYILGLLVIGVPFMIISIIQIPIMVFYSAYCLKRLYKLDFSGIVLRSLIFCIVFAVVCLVLIIVGSIITYLTGGFDGFIEAAKAAKEAKG